MTIPGVPVKEIFRDSSIAFFIAGIAPLIVGFYFGVLPGPLLGLMSGTFILEYGAVIIGTTLHMDEVIIFIVVSLVATGIIFFQLSLFDYVGESSPQVAGFLEYTRGKYGSLPVIKKYGVLALVPGMLVVGFYVCPAVAWLLGWERKIALIIMVGTFCVISALLLPVSEGLIHGISGLLV